MATKNDEFQAELNIFPAYVSDEMRFFLNERVQPYKELLSFYRSAIMEIETKFKVLNVEFSLQNERNPIETIKTRLKSPESISEKLDRKNIKPTIKNIEENLNDIAGIRVICSYPSDIYMLADALLAQDDVTLIQKKDYIANPKPNGYRSLHLIVETPIFLHNNKKQMRVEIQLRTLSMDWWASLEHKIRYKKNLSPEQLEEIGNELLYCASMAQNLDERMEKISNQILNSMKEE